MKKVCTKWQIFPLEKFSTPFRPIRLRCGSARLCKFISLENSRKQKKKEFSMTSSLTSASVTVQCVDLGLLSAASLDPLGPCSWSEGALPLETRGPFFGTLQARDVRSVCRSSLKKLLPWHDLRMRQYLVACQLCFSVYLLGCIPSLWFLISSALFGISVSLSD